MKCELEKCELGQGILTLTGWSGKIVVISVSLYDRYNPRGRSKVVTHCLQML